jgi:hypothetical protein
MWYRINVQGLGRTLDSGKLLLHRQRGQTRQHMFLVRMLIEHYVWCEYGTDIKKE